MKIGFLSIALLVVWPSSASTDVSFAGFQKACGEKTLAYNRDENGKIVKTGEHIGEYCRGLLEGALAVLAAKRAVCISDGAPTPEFLLSIVQTYLADVGSPKEIGSILEAAFRRAFRCSQ